MIKKIYYKWQKHKKRKAILRILKKIEGWQKTKPSLERAFLTLGALRQCSLINSAPIRPLGLKKGKVLKLGQQGLDDAQLAQLKNDLKFHETDTTQFNVIPTYKDRK